MLYTSFSPLMGRICSSVLVRSLGWDSRPEDCKTSPSFAMSSNPPGINRTGFGWITASPFSAAAVR
jgi:hypothetical protein